MFPDSTSLVSNNITDYFNTSRQDKFSYLLQSKKHSASKVTLKLYASNLASSVT